MKAAYLLALCAILFGAVSFAFACHAVVWLLVGALRWMVAP